MRLEDQLFADNLLAPYPITLHCRPGLRAVHMDSEDLVYCAKITHCIINLGNNDISNHPTKSWIVAETPLKTAARLGGFAQQLKSKNVDVKVIGLLPRPDVHIKLVSETNQYLSGYFGVDYVGPRYIHENHFFTPNRPNDLAHLNDDGQKRVLSLYLRIVRDRFKFQPSE